MHKQRLKLGFQSRVEKQGRLFFIILTFTFNLPRDLADLSFEIQANHKLTSPST